MGFDTLQVQVRSKKIYEDLQKLRFSFTNHMKIIEEIYKYTNLSLKKIEEAGKIWKVNFWCFRKYSGA